MLDWVLHNTAFAALLAAGLAVACRFGKIRPALQHALWLVVFARLLLPPVLSWPWRAPELSDVLASLSSRPSEPAPRLSGLHREEGTNDRGGESERDPPGSFVITELTEEVPFGSTALRLRPLGDLRVRPDAPRVVGTSPVRNSQCACVSMKPGTMNLPATLITAVPSGISIEPLAPIAAILLSVTRMSWFCRTLWRSAVVAPDIVMTFAPRNNIEPDGT